MHRVVPTKIGDSLALNIAAPNPSLLGRAGCEFRRFVRGAKPLSDFLIENAFWVLKKANLKQQKTNSL
jgi:hypothetical protein